MTDSVYVSRSQSVERYLCSSSLLSWCRDRGGEGSSISLRSTPGASQQAASMPTPCPGSLSRPRPRRERRPPPCCCCCCCCPVVLMEPCCLLVWSPMALALALPLSCRRRLKIHSGAGGQDTDELIRLQTTTGRNAEPLTTASPRHAML